MKYLITLACALLTTTALAKTFTISGPIDYSDRALIAEILLEAETYPAVINLVIDSPGGYVPVLMQYLEAIWYAQSHGTKIHCQVPGKGVASAAAIIFTQCDRRYAYKDALILFHNLSISLFMVKFDHLSAYKMYEYLYLEQHKLENIVRSQFMTNDRVFRYLNDNAVWFRARRANLFSPGFIHGFIRPRPMPEWN